MRIAADRHRGRRRTLVARVGGREARLPLGEARDAHERGLPEALRSEPTAAVEAAGDATTAPRRSAASSPSWRPGRDVSRLAFYALHALQHRGQESAGIAVQRRAAR